jgi:hypothetical protein
MAIHHTQSTLGEATQTDDDTTAASDLHDEHMADIAERAPYATGSDYVAGPPEGI